MQMRSQSKPISRWRTHRNRVWTCLNLQTRVLLLLLLLLFFYHFHGPFGKITVCKWGPNRNRYRGEGRTGIESGLVWTCKLGCYCCCLFVFFAFPWGNTWSYGVLSSLSGFDRVLLSFMGALSAFTGFWRFLPCFIGFLWFYLVLLN